MNFLNEKAVMKIVEINHHWKKDYDKLQEEHNILKAKFNTMKRKNEKLEQENTLLHKRLHANRIVGIDIPEYEIKYSLDDIEALKQQLLIYKEDFLQEKNDLDRVNKENFKLKLELQSARQTNETLSQNKNVYKENIRKIYLEKEHIIQELRKLAMLPSTNHTSTFRIPCYRTNGETATTGNTYTLKTQKYYSSESLKAEDLIPRCIKVHQENKQFEGAYLKQAIPPRTFGRPRSL